MSRGPEASKSRPKSAANPRKSNFSNKNQFNSLEAMLTSGDPGSPLRWTSKSTRALAAELAAEHHRVSHEKVAQLLPQMDYSLQGNRKADEGCFNSPVAT